MTTTVTAKIQMRKGTAAQWTGANPILLNGELGYETDTGKVKIGDGTTAWATLDYSIDPTVVVDHGALTGLADDDHAQYHTDARGDARYVQVGADAADLGSGTATDNYVLTADGLGGAAWEAPSGGVADGATLSTGLTFPIGGLHILDTNGSHDLIVSPGSDLTADRTLTVTTGDANRTLTLTADASVGGTNTGDQNLSGYATTSHAASHKSAGSDSIKLDELAAPTDVTALNASSSAHGLLPKLENTGTKFLRDDGTWQTATVSRAELHAVALSF